MLTAGELRTTVHLIAMLTTTSGVTTVERLADGEPCERVGSDCAGHGAAMRVEPIGIAHCLDPDTLRWEAAMSALPTHASAVAIASAVATPFGTAHALLRSRGALDATAFLDGIVAMLEGFDPHGGDERKRNKIRMHMADRIAGVADHLDDRVESAPEHVQLVKSRPQADAEQGESQS